MMSYGLGFDTGGTYTDAVLVNFETDRIVSKAKALTTREDLSIGIRNAISNFDKRLFKEISIVSLSSTLATNSIVEGKGCRVGLICIDRKPDNLINVDLYTCIRGKHNMSGAEIEPLDEKAAIDFLHSIKGKVDGLAITGYLSVRNPEHEKRVKKLAQEILDVPVVCGHELSSSLGFNERTVTSVMNSRLIPIIKELIASVNKVLLENEIKAPLMIVKGDGSVMNVETAAERPIETILSGPAASLIGAKRLTGKEDAIIMDIGGTTTDIGILRNGVPRLEKEGALIGGVRTRVLAAEISTSGIGGDSRIVVNGNRVILTPIRVIPLCIAASKWPEINESLRKVAERPSRPSPESVEVSNIVQDIEFFVLTKDYSGRSIPEVDLRFLEFIKERPHSLKEASEHLGIQPLSFNVVRLEEQRIIQRVGLTPTDLLHAENSYVQYDRTASVLGVAHQAAKLRVSPEEFIHRVKGQIIDKLCIELMKKLLIEDIGTEDIDRTAQSLISKAVLNGSGPDFTCSISLNKPIIGIGAPVGAYLPDVAKRFHTELIIPESSEVGNALGAITGGISESIDILIKPLSDGDPEVTPCTVFTKFGKFDLGSYLEGTRFAKEKGEEYVREAAERSGAEDICISSEFKEKRYSLGTDNTKDIILETLVKVTAVGKPKQLRV